MKLQVGDRVQMRSWNPVLKQEVFHFGTVTSVCPELPPWLKSPGHVTITFDYGAGEITGHQDDPALQKIGG
jgi:hypothetical protein